MAIDTGYGGKIAGPKSICCFCKVQMTPNFTQPPPRSDGYGDHVLVFGASWVRFQGLCLGRAAVLGCQCMQIMSLRRFTAITLMYEGLAVFVTRSISPLFRTSRQVKITFAERLEMLIDTTAESIVKESINSGNDT